MPEGDHANDAVPTPSDMPPESFWLSKDAEYDWFDRNAFFERKESTKGNNNNNNNNPNSINPSSNSNSQRFSVTLKSKPSIIGLPKTQKLAFTDSKRRTCKQAHIKLFPKRSESVGKSTGQMVEPGSPNVSCMGRVRSKRARRRSNSVKRGVNKPVEKAKTGGEKQKTGFYFKVMSIFRSKKGQKKSSRSGSRRVVEDEAVVVVEPERKSVSVEPPGLGGMKRYVSGRRSESWGSEDFNRGS